MSNRSKILSTAVVVAVILGGFFFWQSRKAPQVTQVPAGTTPTETENKTVKTASEGFGADVVYEAPDGGIAASVAGDFDMATIANVADMEKAYGFVFSAAERKALAEQKFVMKQLHETTVRPSSGGDNVREFVQLYGQLKGPDDYRARGPENSLFFSADVFLHAYNNLFTELLKEMENETFSPAMAALSSRFFEAAKVRAASATSDTEKKKWTKVRDYFAVPNVIFSSIGKPLSTDDYYAGGKMRDPSEVRAEHVAADGKIDTYEAVAARVPALGLDAASEAAVLKDLRTIYDASKPAAPAVFEEEYRAYSAQEKIDFQVDFTQFTPRGTYTSSSLRRQYFRGMKWYIMVPFFLKSPALTDYAYGTAELMAADPEALHDYDKLESAIGFMVGTSDDLMPADYLLALAEAKGSPDQAAAAMAYLVKARDPKIKDIAASYQAIGTEQSDDVRLKSKGMRFFSGKFIVDSYWTGYLTQGDEAPRPGYTQKLPPMASSLEVMTLLGSSYAESQIPKLDFYSPKNSEAIAKALGELKTETAALTDADWRRNLYTGWLWTIKGMFGWEAAHKAELPRFMQSVAWETKTLMTASASWAELRHATILYAKQSFAELGGGPGGACDPRAVPPPPKAYIEPQAEAYARLQYLARRTSQGLKGQGYELANLDRLDNFVALLDTVQSYVKKQLDDATLQEKIVRATRPDPEDPSKECAEQVIDSESDWENLRLGIVRGLLGAVPVPVEGPILPAKDRRVALVADVHTGGDSQHPRSILYEATGVPAMIFVAVSDANGPRLTAGFASTHYESVVLYGGKRMTDEDWQQRFYIGNDDYDAFNYAPAASWPKMNAWYSALFDL